MWIQYSMIWHVVLRRRNTDDSLNSQNTAQVSQTSYGVFIVKLWDKINRVLAEQRRIWPDSWKMPPPAPILVAFKESW